MKTSTPTRDRKPNARQKAWQGMNWISQHRRLGIYLRDGLACAWCAVGIEDGAQLTLDHVRAHRDGGGNENTNLVTACKRCNDSRGARSVRKFATVTAAYLNHGIKPEAIVGHVRAQLKKSVDVAAAKALIARRGSVAKVLSAHNPK
jgi:hypothetical protein